MRYGICVAIDNHEGIGYAAKCGYDFVEGRFGHLARSEDADFAKWKESCREFNINFEAVNCFMPGDLGMTGPGEINYEGMKEYIDKGMYRGCELGLKTVVFGSGGARRIPDGFSYAEGAKQIVYFLKEIVAPIAEKYKITVVNEPLRHQDSNIMNSLKEGVILAGFAESEYISCLADIYHMDGVGEKIEDILPLKGHIKHAHIANPNLRDGKIRMFPIDVNEFDYKGFIDALRYVGCETCTIEASTNDFEKEAPISLALLRSL